MKKICLLFIILAITLSAQTFEVKVHHLSKKDILGSEMVFDMTIKNIGSQSQTLAIIRESNILPADWHSSLCFTSCFASHVDTIKTTRDYGSNAIAPGDSIKISLHVFSKNNPGTARVKLKIVDLSSPSNHKSFDFEAVAGKTTGITENNEKIPVKFNLAQNYPNPFNPATKIEFGITEESRVKIEVFNILGEKVTILTDKFLTPGTYTVDFSAQNLPSGVYFYKLTANNYTKVRKMILEK